ncbi:MAG: nuclear transport factor 2 family protein [Burkholderiaceae bacterium]
MEAPTEQSVLAWEQQRRTALLTGDAEALAPLLSDALVYVHSTAARDGKASYLAKLRDGALRYLSLEFDQLQAQVSDGAALVTGHVRATVRKDGQDKAVRSMFLTVWLPEPAGAAVVWRLRAHQGTPLPA